MATFLQICKDVHRLVRSDNNEPGTYPISVSGQTFTLADIVFCVQKAWRKIQMHHADWLWMRGSVSVTLTAGVNVVNVANFRTQQARFQEIVPYVAESDRRYVNIRDNNAVNAADNRCYFVEWQEFSGWWTRRPLPANALPFFFSEQPNRSIQLYPAPSTPASGGNWLLTTGCRFTVQDLVADTDEPEMPPEFHDLITWVAVDLFCASRSNLSSLRVDAKEAAREWMFKLAANQLPEMTECQRYV